MNIKRKAGTRIKQLRKEKGMSQEQLANQAKVDRAYVGRVERGEVNISITVLELLLDELEVNMYEFFSGGVFEEKPF